MKNLLRRIVIALTKKLLPLLQEAEAQAMVSKFKRCGKNLALFPPLCIRGPENMTLGDDVALGTYVHIWGQGGIRIGDRVMIAAHTSITSLTHDYHVENMHASNLMKEVVIEDDVWIGTNCTLLPGVTIGKGAVVGAGSVISSDVAPYAIIAPERPLVRKYRDVPGSPFGPRGSSP